MGHRESGGSIRPVISRIKYEAITYGGLWCTNSRDKREEDALRGSLQRPPPYTREQLHMCPEVVCMCRRVTLPSHARVNQICAYACDQKDRSLAPSVPIERGILLRLVVRATPGGYGGGADSRRRQAPTTVACLTLTFESPRR